MVRRCRDAWFLAILLAVVGCGGDKGPVKYEVTGIVTYDGAPIEDGEIRFMAPDGTGTVGAARIVDGEFKLLSEAGTKRVEIRSGVELKKMPERMKPPGGMTLPAGLKVERLPKNYNRDSTLEEEVVPRGENHFVFDLTK